ncbi:hypothetical protein [Candidatus Similichlamydia laticola]|uniref:hypothetical protein n=1 Tax=Candidatus Similichlamydia laticola TaxID=2170265 RepID=UPI0011C06739|nr:hypothetical protein [Candidatus Similichlamydia laticola]
MNRRPRRLFSVLEVLAAFSLISLVSIPMLLPILKLTENRRLSIEKMFFARRAEVAWHTILRRETLEKFRLSWESFNTKEEHIFDWDECSIPELGKRSYSLKVSFKRICQTPKRQKGLPWKRIIAVRLLVYKGANTLVEVFDRSLILEKKNRFSQIDGLA